jgi:hypothetical protein
MCWFLQPALMSHAFGVGFKTGTTTHMRPMTEKKKGVGSMNCADASSSTSPHIHIHGIDQEAMGEKSRTSIVFHGKTNQEHSSHIRPYINNNKLATLHTRVHVQIQQELIGPRTQTPIHFPFHKNREIPRQKRKGEHHPETK